MTTTLADLWHRTGRAARDDRKRLLSLYAVLATVPALLLGSLLARLLTGAPVAFGAMRRPAAYVADPLVSAWMHDDDLAVLLWLLVQSLALAVPWGLLGGAVARMAAVDLATGRREPPPQALAFARRHALGFVGSKAALAAAVLVPLALASLVTMLGRWSGPAGTALFTVGVVVAGALVVAAVLAGSVAAAAGFVAGPTIACEDSDAFDAVSRVFGYAAAGLPRLLAVRLAFLGGALLGASWRLLRTAAALVLLALALEAGAGRDRADALFAALADLGRGRTAPWGDLVPALAFAAVGATLVALWLADFASRVVCGRVGAYLWLRQAVDRLPTDRLRTAPAGPTFSDAESAGFVEVSRIGVPTKRPSR